MYTNLTNVQILISLLKQFNVSKLVLSPGNRDIPLVHSVETDHDFECYSIVDERSAAYFALGLSDASNEPVGFVCTSSTASCNYMPAIEEAARKSIKLIALTADRENYYLYQFEDQKINQTDMYYPYTKCSADLPVVRNDLDKWLCIRKVNEVLISMSDGKPGPVHINFQVNRTDLFTARSLPMYRKITKYNQEEFFKELKRFNNELKDKKIMLIIGENYYGSSKFSVSLEMFQKYHNAVVIADHFSNLAGGFLFTAQALETFTSDDFEKYAPDVVITFGGHMWSSLKYYLRNSTSNFVHWRVSDDTIVRDGFKRLQYIFDVNPSVFLENLCEEYENNKNYYLLWKNKVENTSLPDLKFSNFSVIKQVMNMLPENSVVHCSILNSARLNAFSMYGASNIKTYCNFGCDGIDGCMSSFLGQTFANDALSILVIGDLSYLYDVNVTFEEFSSEKRILLINNHAGSEFHTAFGLKRFATLNKHIAAGHENDLIDIIDTNKFRYISASNQKELDEAITVFISKSENPIILEVFTDANQDGVVLNSFYNKNRVYKLKTKVEQKAKGIIRKILKV